MRAVIASEAAPRSTNAASRSSSRFANTQPNRHITRFWRRGRSAARTEWRLITATRNRLKLHGHHLAVT